jgi:hypothetical protein
LPPDIKGICQPRRQSRSGALQDVDFSSTSFCDRQFRLANPAVTSGATIAAKSAATIATMMDTHNGIVIVIFHPKTSLYGDYEKVATTNVTASATTSQMRCR